MIRIFDYPRSSISAKIRLYGYGAKSWWGLTWGQWVQKMGHHGKKITIPQNSNFRLPRSHRFRPKFEFTVKSRCRPPSVHFVPIGSKEWVKTVKNYHALKFDYATTPRSSISTKIRLYGYGAKSRWGLPRVHLGPMGSDWVQKMGHHRKKLPCPQIRLCPAVIDFDQKFI